MSDNKLKATPGPYFIKREGWSAVYVEARIGGGMLQEVAACGPTEAGQAQQEANANLLAASWEMYQALKGVLPFMEQAEAAGLVGDEGCIWPVEMVRDALRKAEGHA